MKQSAMWLVVVTVLLALLTGCYIDRGKLRFEALGLDPIVLYQLQPVERTAYCLAEYAPTDALDFDGHHAAALASVEQAPDQADWSELVCLTLAGSTEAEQIRSTISALQKVSETQEHKQGQQHPVEGYVRLLERQLAYLDQLALERSELRELESRLSKSRETALQERISLQEIIGAQQEKIRALATQVQKLKEVELQLQPQER